MFTLGDVMVQKTVRKKRRKTGKGYRPRAVSRLKRIARTRLRNKRNASR
jgi:hypothetical protein